MAEGRLILRTCAKKRFLSIMTGSRHGVLAASFSSSHISTPASWKRTGAAFLTTLLLTELELTEISG